MASTAVIGTGHWGKNILRNLYAMDQLSAFCDSNSVRREEFGKKYPDVKSFSDPDEVFSDSEIDAVVIATPAITHGELAMRSLEAGKHTFVEKPLCLDVEEAKRLSNLADSRNLTLMVGHLLLYHPAFKALESAVADGKIGRLRYIYSNRVSLGLIRREENALWSFAPHDISMMLALTKKLPKRVVCNGNSWLKSDVVDLSLSYFDFGDDLQSHIFVSWLHPYKDHRIVVIGEKGMLVFNDTSSGEDKLLLYPHSVEVTDVDSVLTKGDTEPVAYGNEEPLRSEMEHFISCCEHGSQPRSSAQEGIAVLRVLTMCQTALTNSTAVELED